MDVTDMVNYNVELINHNDLPGSFFHLDRNDPTAGFPYDASSYVGHTYPATPLRPTSSSASAPAHPQQQPQATLTLRLVLGSHLARHIRYQLEERTGYTATVGISTNKLLSKLVGNVNKPNGQTTLTPPYVDCGPNTSNVLRFLDDFEIGKIPGIGFKLALNIRQHVLRRQPTVVESGSVNGTTKEKLTVKELRAFPDLSPELLESIVGGPGAPKGIGSRVWGLLFGVDDAELGRAKTVPSQISIEDSYLRLDTLDEVKKELQMLVGSLIRRMRTDLTELDLDYDRSGDPAGSADSVTHGQSATRRWLAHPRTLRLTTRPRPALNPEGNRSRAFNRVSRTSPLPTFAFSLDLSVHTLAEKLVCEVLIPLFRKLHPEKSGWDLSLLNVAVTNMAEAASDDRRGTGRDIGRMFQRQHSVLQEWKADDDDRRPPVEEVKGEGASDRAGLARHPFDEPREGQVTAVQSWYPGGSATMLQTGQEHRGDDGGWDDGEEPDLGCGRRCVTCGVMVPMFAIAAHLRYHTLPD